MSRRIRTDILARILRENPAMPPHFVARLVELEKELIDAATREITFLADDAQDDVQVWNKEILEPHVAAARTWLSAPWLVTEFFFYRRVLQCVDWFSESLDPFEQQKQLGVTTSREPMMALADRVSRVLGTSVLPDTALRSFVVTALWGNRMDLSIWPVGGDRGSGHQVLTVADETQAKLILADHFPRLLDFILTKELPLNRVDIVVDNAGLELFCDLCLADYLIAAGIATVCVIQLKGHPTFVSDAMEKDLMFMLDYMRNVPDDARLHELAERWLDRVRSGQWILREDAFWAQGSPFWAMPDRIYDDLRRHSSLTFVKGDANYRRLLGDLHWDFSTDFADIVAYFPTAVCALRTLKAEIACGLGPEAIQRAQAEDPNWLVSGKWGVIHFSDPLPL